MNMDFASLQSALLLTSQGMLGIFTAMILIALIIFFCSKFRK